MGNWSRACKEEGDTTPLQNLAHEILKAGKLTGDQSPNSGVLVAL
jgi:hypothetical protein